jgi:hypothetical protein
MTGLYEALAARNVLLDGVLVPVYTPDTLPGVVQSAHLPARLLLPVRGGARSLTARSLNGGRSVALWELVDLALFMPVGQGRGPRESAPLLARYSAAYREAMQAGWQIATHAVVMSVTLAGGVFAYPDGGEGRYFGVEARLVVREVV